MTKRPGLPVAVRAELDKRKAMGVSRYLAKAELRQGGATAWSLSTGRIHSDSTLEAYKRHATAYARWARDRYGIRKLEELHAHAGELVPAYLQTHLEAGHSPYTVQLVRSALRMLHQDWTLGHDVHIPPRRREAITRSRLPVARDLGINLDHYRPLTAFLGATGLRRREVEGLMAGQVLDGSGGLCVFVDNGKGGKQRLVPVLPGSEAHVRDVVRGKAPNQVVFDRVPSRLDVHAYRRQYAQALYVALSGRELPDPHGRLEASGYDAAAVLRVSEALGHNRIDVVLTNYLR